MTAVAADVDETDLVLLEQLVEPPPKVFVLDLAAPPRAAASRGLPLRQPLGQAPPT